MPDEDLNLDDIAGTKCRVAYHTDWGPTTWHNAMIFCAEPVVAEEAPVVSHGYYEYQPLSYRIYYGNI